MDRTSYKSYELNGIMKDIHDDKNEQMPWIHVKANKPPGPIFNKLKI